MAGKGKKRQYSDSDKASALAALDANGGNVSRTARQLNMPRVTLLEWSKGRKQHPDVSDLRQEKKRELADKLEELAHSIIDAAPGKIDKAGLKDSMIAAGTAIDKMQLLRGKPTTIIAETARETFRKFVDPAGEYRMKPEEAAAVVLSEFPGVTAEELVSEAVN